MTIKSAAILSTFFIASCLGAYASSAPFGVLSAYNLVALSGNVVGPTGSDVQGRVAASGQILTAFSSVGAGLSGNDPYGSLANGYAMVAAGGVNVPSGGTIQINGGGGVWATTNNAKYNFNDGGALTLAGKGGTSPIDFAAEQKAMTTLASNLAGLKANGTTTVDTGNQTWLDLNGTSSTLNVFNVTASQLASKELNFITNSSDKGATIIVNVTGSASEVLGGGAVMVNGQQEGDQNNDNGLILFNFETATSVAINAQFDAAVLAPNAVVTASGGQLGGNIIAASIGLTDEAHDVPFEGVLPIFASAIPEPGSFTLLATGVFLLAGLGFMRRNDKKTVPVRL
jgi:choice-of-anchor A domain-containing protein